ncbi:MAG: LysR family transcriptional regulator [Candidatus Bathyarchaeia archaeon]
MKELRQELRPVFKVWLEIDGRPVIGKGGAEILEAIEQVQSISGAARSLGMSYRYVWDYVSKMTTLLQEPLVTTWRGGGGGGGGACLTQAAKTLVKEYRAAERCVHAALQGL